MTNEEAARVVEFARAPVETYLREVLSRDPATSACITLNSDGDGGCSVVGLNALQFASMKSLETGDPDRSLYDAIKDALHRPRAAGTEWVVINGTGAPMTMAFATTVRKTLAEILPVPETQDEQRAHEFAPYMVLAMETPLQTVEDCVARVDDTLIEVWRNVAPGKEALLTAYGRKLSRWCRERGERARSATRHALMLRTLLAAGFDEEARWLRRVGEVVRDLVLPPVISAQNLEVLAMSASVTFNVLRWVEDGEGFDGRDGFDAWGAAGVVSHLLDAVCPQMVAAGLLGERGGFDVPRMSPFLEAWRSSAFARLEVSHKLAAALCLTDVPESDDLRAPWMAWSLLVPNDLLGETQPQRIWCMGIEPVFLVSKAGMVTPWSEESAGGPVAAEMLRSLVRSACVVLSDPERKRAEGRWGTPPHGHSRSNRTVGAPPEGSRYLLAQPVTIDLRDTVTEALTGKRRGGSPKVQFLVRGHPTNQAYGPRQTLRRLQWIEPYWKGDPAARVLLRGHRVEDGEGKPTPDGKPPKKTVT
jgi:hypothetical protein